MIFTTVGLEPLECRRRANGRSTIKNKFKSWTFTRTDLTKKDSWGGRVHGNGGGEGEGERGYGEEEEDFDENK